MNAEDRKLQAEEAKRRARRRREAEEARARLRRKRDYRPPAPFPAELVARILADEPVVRVLEENTQ